MTEWVTGGTIPAGPSKLLIDRGECDITRFVTRPSWADRVGYAVFVPPHHGVYVFPLSADDVVELDE